MKTERTILAVIVVALSSYSLITDNYGILPYINLLLGFMLLLSGINEIQENRKGTAVSLLLAALFGLYVGIVTI